VDSSGTGLPERTGCASHAAAQAHDLVRCTVAARVGAALTAGALQLSSARSPVSAAPARFEITLPEGMRVDSVYDRAAISPDGHSLVFSASLNGRAQLFTRDLGSTAVVGLDDAENAFDPFWSPDNASVASQRNARFHTTAACSRSGVVTGESCST
jgi:hypothetical protein